VARVGYQPKGYVLDFFIIPDDGHPTTFLNGETYYIKTSYSEGDPIYPVVFEPGCTIKFKNNAYMLLYGPVSFPSLQPNAIFTSRNDNNFGEAIEGVPGELPNDGNPALHKAAQAIWIYYVAFNTTIQNARIRWAQKSIQYDVNPGVNITHTLQSSLLEYSDTGVYANIQNATLVLNNVTKCTVTAPVSCPGACGTINGSPTDDCGVVSIARVNNPSQDSASGDPNKNSQSECSFVVVDSSKIVAAFFDTHLSEYLLGITSFPGITSPRSSGWAVSVNGGATFTDNGAIPPIAPANTSQGDAGDPVMARDTNNGTIYLLANPSRETDTWDGFRLWKSTDGGQTLSLVNTSVPSDVASADKPMIAVNNFSGSLNYHHLYVSGTEAPGVFVTHSTNGGASWDAKQLLNSGGHGSDLVIAPDGTVYVFYIVNTFIGPPYQVGLEYSWRRPTETSWHTPVAISAHGDSQNFYSTNANASGNPKRSNLAAEADFFVSNGFPRAAVNPINGRIYLVYADLPFAGLSTDRGDIFINEGVPQADGSLNWTGVRKLNNDGTTTDQWNPSIAINPAGTVLFVGYYSRQGDPSNNALIKAYGAKTILANGFATATFDVFPISATAFPPLFPGTTTSTPSCDTWKYDHVWAQTGVCLDDNAMFPDCLIWPTCQHPTDSTFQHFMADDYTWASAHGSYFFHAWCDRSETYFTGGNSRPDPNIRLGKIKQ